ncbi:MAG: hypothetical protein BJ554DRAFT_8125, partial [Olpidium bornovanus]
ETPSPTGSRVSNSYSLGRHPEGSWTVGASVGFDDGIGGDTWRFGAELTWERRGEAIPTRRPVEVFDEASSKRSARARRPPGYVAPGGPAATAAFYIDGENFETDLTAEALPGRNGERGHRLGACDGA